MTGPETPAVDPDDRLFARWQAGDDAALTELLRLELPWLRGHVAERLGPRLRAKDETQDHVQDALVEFLRDAPRFRVESRAQLRALLSRVVENNLRDKDDWYRARRRAMHRESPLPTETVLQLGVAQPTQTTPSAAASSSEWSAWVRLALEFLDPDDRRILVLREWDDRSFVEIGEMFGMTPNAVRMRWTRAVGRLADRVRELQAGRIGT
ncbi:MAG: sigma-70 family RNA polymerase sigma factor [Planctomycetes bacterium]|nr:sigma-70 family RNA polymerase sigma factor [Planctomycetota bacterium]